MGGPFPVLEVVRGALPLALPEVRSTKKGAVSTYADEAGEPGLLVFDHMAMEGPIPRIICHERNLGDLAFPEQVRVRPVLRNRPQSGAKGFKGHAVKVDRVAVGALVLEAHDVALPEL